ncbi:MAG TPA: inositol monophosphatase family protein, partial [Burkholderiaceae bacterium]|nr:inositol monophosphatase family protein [Burkholderiaceae bacterium]
HLQASRSRLSEIVITHKAPGDVVRAIDHEARTLIGDVVMRHFPGHSFAGEAGVEAAELLADGRPAWIVDPIDGATNYLRGYPQYAVTIALVEAGEPQVGVVYDPSRNEFFGAIRGRGAVLNGQAIRCAKPRPAGESLAATVFPKPASPRMPIYMAELGRVLRAFSGVRRSGSMALELAYLAAGRIDAFWQHEMRAWECAAGAVLLREAGALIHARDGLPLLASRSLLACTPTLFEPFLSLLAEA